MVSPHTSKDDRTFKRLWWVGFLMVLAAVMVNTLIWLGARALFAVASSFQPLQLESFIPFTVIGVVGAVIVFALLVRWAKHPIRLFQRIAVSVLLISFIPDILLLLVRIYPGTTFPEVGALLLMHGATAFICIATLRTGGPIGSGRETKSSTSTRTQGHDPGREYDLP